MELVESRQCSRKEEVSVILRTDAQMCSLFYPLAGDPFHVTQRTLVVITTLMLTFAANALFSIDLTADASIVHLSSTACDFKTKPPTCGATVLHAFDCKDAAPPAPFCNKSLCDPYRLPDPERPGYLLPDCLTLQPDNSAEGQLCNRQKIALEKCPRKLRPSVKKCTSCLDVNNVGIDINKLSLQQFAIPFLCAVMTIPFIAILTYLFSWLRKPLENAIDHDARLKRNAIIMGTVSNVHTSVSHVGKAIKHKAMMELGELGNTEDSEFESMLANIDEEEQHEKQVRLRFCRIRSCPACAFTVAPLTSFFASAACFVSLPPPSPPRLLALTDGRAGAGPHPRAGGGTHRQRRGRPRRAAGERRRQEQGEDFATLAAAAAAAACGALAVARASAVCRC